MVKSIKLDGRNNYLFDPNSDEIISKYSSNLKEKYPHFKLRLTLPDQSILTVDGDNITEEYGGDIIVQYNNDKFIIDDGYQPVLLKAGYMIYQNYDTDKHYDKATGIQLRESIMNDIEKVFTKWMSDYLNEAQIDKIGNSELALITYDPASGFNYKINAETVQSIVTKNHMRKDNSLSFYPFSKKMDRYGTVYISIFGQRILECAKDADRFTFPDKFIKYLTEELGPNYHFGAQIVRKRLVDYKGL